VLLTISRSFSSSSAKLLPSTEKRGSQSVDATLKSSPPAIENKGQIARWVRSAGTLSLARYSPSEVKQIGSPRKALSNQRIGNCCIDRLSRRDLSSSTVRSVAWTGEIEFQLSHEVENRPRIR
jgi:hypothetical protein